MHQSAEGTRGRRGVQQTRTGEQASCLLDMSLGNRGHRRAGQRRRQLRDLLDLLQVGTAAAASGGTVDCGAADRATHHLSGFEIEQQIGQLPTRFVQGRRVIVCCRVADRFDQIDHLVAVLLARLVEFGLCFR